MSGLPQLENLFWPQCGFELTMLRSEDSCANQLRHPGTIFDIYIFDYLIYIILPIFIGSFVQILCKYMIYIC